MTVTAAGALAAQLGSYGVEYVFGTCGHTNIAFLDALSRTSIRFVIGRHEQTAAHAADGYARATGKPGVLLLHAGPGMMNAVTGVATAALDSVPLIAIAGDVPSYYAGRHPHQEINLHDDAGQAAIYRPFSKRTWQVHRADDLPRFTERAFWTATSGRPGAVLLNVPMDVFSRPVPEDLARRYLLPAEPAGPALEQETADRIAELLITAERPLIYIGGGLRTGAARKALLALAEHLDIPVAHSLMAKGTVPDSHPLLLGMPGFWGLELTNDYARDADLVLALGTRFAETDASSWHPDFTWRFPPSRLVQIDIDPAEIGRNYPVEIGAIADAALAVTAIADAVSRTRSEPLSRDGLRETITAARASAFAVVRDQGRSAQFPLRPQRILADLRAALPADAVLVTDVGWNKNGVAQCYELPAEGRFIAPGGASTMGFGPAAAVGVQLGCPERVVVALVGDGGMSAQLPAIPMAVEQGLPVVFVVRSALAEVLRRRRPAVIDVPMVNDPVPAPGHWNITDIYQGVFDLP